MSHNPVRQFICLSCGKVVPVLYGARPLRCACGHDRFGEIVSFTSTRATPITDLMRAALNGMLTITEDTSQ